MKSRILLITNYATLILMNLVFYYVYVKNPPHYVDAIGLLCLAAVAVTFFPLHLKSGVWKLTHSHQDKLDEREIKITQSALSESYSWFTVICLLVILAQSIIARMNICPRYSITVPLAGSLIYLAHTLPGSVLIWRKQS